ncbi:MAG: ATP-binding cassette domain-containing protein [Chthoniobacterales bacterium]|nr:ATP-binding cassette domain-containing protein [Chthoniobacterales bacterium]
MLRVEDLHVSIGGSRILRGVTFHVPKNSIFCIMGRNGVGKTTTLKTLLGLYRPTSGRIVFKDQDITHFLPEQRARLGIGYVPQGRCIFPHLTVQENLLIGAIAQGKSFQHTLKRIHSLFPILYDFRNRKGGMLSGGQQQQLAIARALMTDPDLLVLDEPTEGIQPNIIDQIGDTIKLLQRGSHHDEIGLLTQISSLIKKQRATAQAHLVDSLDELHQLVISLERSYPQTKREDYLHLAQLFAQVRSLCPSDGSSLGEQIAEAIAKLHAEKRVTILLVEQYLDFCREIADQFAILDRGTVAAKGHITSLTDQIIKDYLAV